jgi:hypothetical protein
VSGTFPGRSGGWQQGDAGSQREFDQAAREQRQQERQAAAEEGRSGRQDARDDAREDWQKYGNNQREDWQDYADDHYEEHGHGYYYGGTAPAVATGVAIGAAAAVPPYWTLPCTPETVVVGGSTYYHCDTAWYARAYSGGDVTYIIVNPPPGY